MEFLMPIYEYLCEEGHRTTRIFKTINSIAEDGFRATDRYVPCERCDDFRVDEESSSVKYAEKQFSSFNGVANDDGRGLVYFENKQGHIEFSSIADKDNWQPEGYVKKEARNLHERELLETKLRKQDDARLAEQFEKRDIQRHYSEQVRHAEIRNMINQGVVDDRSAALLRKGMERTIKRRKDRPKSELRLAVNHESASTLKNRK